MFNIFKRNTSPFREINSNAPVIKLMLREALDISDMFRGQSGSLSYQKASTLECVMILLSYGLYQIQIYNNMDAVWKHGLKKDMANLISDEMKDVLLLNGYKYFEDYAKNRFTFAEISLKNMIEGDGTFLQMGLTKLALDHPLINLQFEIDWENNLLIDEKFLCKDLSKVFVFTQQMVSALERYDEVCSIVINSI